MFSDDELRKLKKLKLNIVHEGFLLTAMQQVLVGNKPMMDYVKRIGIASPDKAEAEIIDFIQYVAKRVK